MSLLKFNKDKYRNLRDGVLFFLPDKHRKAVIETGIVGKFFTKEFGKIVRFHFVCSFRRCDPSTVIESEGFLLFQSAQIFSISFFELWLIDIYQQNMFLQRVPFQCNWQ